MRLLNVSVGAAVVVSGKLCETANRNGRAVRRACCQTSMDWTLSSVFDQKDGLFFENDRDGPSRLDSAWAAVSSLGVMDRGALP